MATKIEKKIVDYSIKKEVIDEPSSPSPAKLLMHEDVARPDELKGYTYKIKTPLSDHAMYITINNIVLNLGDEHEQEFPFEVFINSKNMEQFQWILALTRVISAVFRKGGDATFLVEELKQKGLAVQQKTSVHPSSLRSLVTEQIRDLGKDVPAELFGTYVANKTKITTKE